MWRQSRALCEKAPRFSSTAQSIGIGGTFGRYQITIPGESCPWTLSISARKANWFQQLDKRQAQRCPPDGAAPMYNDVDRVSPATLAESDPNLPNLQSGGTGFDWMDRVHESGGGNNPQSREDKLRSPCKYWSKTVEALLEKKDLLKFKGKECRLRWKKGPTNANFSAARGLDTAKMRAGVQLCTCGARKRLNLDFTPLLPN